MRSQLKNLDSKRENGKLSEIQKRTARLKRNWLDNIKDDVLKRRLKRAPGPCCFFPQGVTNLEHFLANSLWTGAVASVSTALAATACGAIENGKALAPLNAVSHIFWGDEAARRDGPSWKYTAVGLALNTAATTSWAALYEMLFGRAAAKSDLVGPFLGGAVVSVIAYITDFHIVPAWLTPGFEKRLSNRSMLGIYAALALGVTFGSLWQPDFEKRNE